MHAPHACLLCAATLGIAAFAVSVARAQPMPPQGGSMPTFVAASAPSVVALEVPASGCAEVSVTGEAGRRIVLTLFDARGRTLAPATTGIGSVVVNACPEDAPRWYAVVQTSDDGPVSVRAIARTDGASQAADAPLAPAAVGLGPGAGFSAARRLSAGVAQAETIGYAVLEPPFEPPFDPSGVASIPMPTSSTCASLRIEVDDGAVRFEGGATIAEGTGAAFDVCAIGRASLRMLRSSGAPRVCAVWLGGHAGMRGAAATRPEAAGAAVALEARGLTPRTLALVVPNGTQVPVPLARVEGSCFGLAAVSSVPVELVLADVRGRILARAVSAIGTAPAVFHCPDGDESPVAWVRSAASGDPIRLLIGEEESP